MLGATNFPWQLDEAMRRRLEKRICTSMHQDRAAENQNLVIRESKQKKTQEFCHKENLRSLSHNLLLTMKIDPEDIPLPDLEARKQVFGINMKVMPHENTQTYTGLWTSDFNRPCPPFLLPLLEYKHG